MPRSSNSKKYPAAAAVMRLVGRSWLLDQLEHCVSRSHSVKHQHPEKPSTFSVSLLKQIEVPLVIRVFMIRVFICNPVEDDSQYPVRYGLLRRAGLRSGVSGGDG